MLWRVYNTYSVIFPMEEFRTAFQAFQYAGLPFAAKILRQAALLCSEPDQAFRFMCVQPIADKRPWCPWIRFDQCPHGLHEILFGTCGVQVRGFHTPRGNVEETGQAGRPMANVFKFHTCCLSGDYGLVRIFVLQCLDSGHLVYGYGMAACRTDRFSLMVNGTDFIHFFRKSLRRIHFLGGMKPIADEMRVDFPHILKNGLPFWRIWNPQSQPL